MAITVRNFIMFDFEAAAITNEFYRQAIDDLRYRRWVLKTVVEDGVPAVTQTINGVVELT